MGTLKDDQLHVYIIGKQCYSAKVDSLLTKLQGLGREGTGEERAGLAWVFL